MMFLHTNDSIAANIPRLLTFSTRSGLLLSPDERSTVFDAVRFWDGQRLDLDAALVLPDRVEMIFRKRDPVIALHRLIGSIKGFAARKVNKGRGRRGPFWKPKNTKQQLTTETAWLQAVHQLRNKPLQAGWTRHPEAYPWLHLSEESQARLDFEEAKPLPL